MVVWFTQLGQTWLLLSWNLTNQPTNWRGLASPKYESSLYCGEKERKEMCMLHVPWASRKPTVQRRAAGSPARCRKLRPRQRLQRPCRTRWGEGPMLPVAGSRVVGRRIGKNRLSVRWEGLWEPDGPIRSRAGRNRIRFRLRWVPNRRTTASRTVRPLEAVGEREKEDRLIDWNRNCLQNNGMLNFYCMI